MDLNINLNGVKLHAQARWPSARLLQPIEEKADEFVFRIDNSSLEAFNTCPRSAEYRLVENRVSHPSSALVFGSAIHAGLEAWYKLVQYDEQPDFESAMRMAFDVASQVYNKEMQACTASGFGDDWRNLDRVIDTLHRYFSHYQFDDVEVYDSHIEQAFSAPLAIITFNKSVPGYYVKDMEQAESVFVNKIHVYWTGRIDLIVKDQGGLWVMDHKTTSMLGPTFWDNFVLSSQMIGYCWAAEKVVVREPIKGVIVNAIAGRKPTRTGVGTEFHRRHFYYSEDQILAWKKNTIALVGNFLSALKSGFFPMSTTWCIGKYGKCRYHDVCSLPEKDKLPYLYSDYYSDNTWSPLTEDTSNE